MAVQFRQVVGFAQMDRYQAEHIIYGELLPACEKQGIVLSRYGNLAYTGAPALDPKYYQIKEKKELFNIERIQKACRDIDFVAQNDPLLGYHSLKTKVESQGEDITTGDLVVALLVRGHLADFHLPRTMECDIRMALLRP